MENNEVMKLLQDNQVVDFCVKDGQIRLMELSDTYFFVVLSKEQALALADEIKAMAESL